MQVKRHLTRSYFSMFTVALTACALVTLTRTSSAEDQPKFDRAQTIIVNLNKMEGCAGWWLLQDIKDAQKMTHDLGKAHFQLQEADRTYAKLRGHPDDKFLTTVQMKVEKCQQDRAQLEEDLHDAFDQLRTTIKDVLLADDDLKKKNAH
jgi:hypothetical protein